MMWHACWEDHNGYHDVLMFDLGFGPVVVGVRNFHSTKVGYSLIYQQFIEDWMPYCHLETEAECVRFDLEELS